MSTPSAPPCKSCEQPLMAVGTHWFCRDAMCSRYARSVNDRGDTPEEHEAACHAQADGQAERYAARVMDGGES